MSVWLSMLVGMAAATPTDPVLAHPRPDRAPTAYRRAPDGSWPALLTASAALSDDQVRALEGAGVRFRRDERGALREVGGIYPVRGTADALEAARALGVRVEVAKQVPRGLPTETTGLEVGALDLWAAGRSPLDGYLGEGVVIADFDSSLDLFHPHFFRADAGWYDWVDLDGDGVLDPGVDGVDLDGDGAIGPTETLELLNGWTMHFDYTEWEYVYEHDAPKRFEPDRDWLYLDLDGNRQRDFGKDAGFNKDDPAFGEPLFVPDDADRNGLLDPHERVARLGTSVVKAAWVDGQTYRRGGNLLQYATASEGWELGHGTGVSGILVGGQLVHSRRYFGLAPEADLLFADRPSDYAAWLEAIDWFADEGADVVLYETAWFFGDFRDGSSPLELAVDQLAADGIAQICPTGNVGGSGKHTVATSAAGSVRLGFEVPGALTGNLGLNLLHADASEVLRCEVVDPGGARHPVAANGYEVVGTLELWSARYTSDRGNAMQWIDLSDANGQLASGTWEVVCTHDGGGPLEVHGFLDDYTTGWGRGASWEIEVPDGTIGFPASSDTCIAVGAYGGRWDTNDGDVGELRGYTSRGPTWDGRRTVDVAAPDDPFAPVELYPSEGWEAVYGAFGGTSGASPHVAALAALMLEAEPGLDGNELRERLIRSARVDAQVDAPAFPDHGWGHGKVRGYEALLGEEPPDLPLEDVFVEVRSDPDGACTTLSASNREGVAADYAWDLDYDGVFDVMDRDTVDVARWVRGGEVRYRVAAGRDGWWIGARAATLRVGPECADRGCGCAVGGSGAGALPLLVVGLHLRSRRRGTGPRGAPVDRARSAG